MLGDNTPGCIQEEHKCFSNCYDPSEPIGSLGNNKNKNNLKPYQRS